MSDDLRARLEAHAGRLLDLWARKGWDEVRGGWHERLGPDRGPVPVDFRRVMVAGRMMFLFSAGRPFGEPGRDRALARRTLEFARDRLRDPVHGGWWFKVDLDGRPTDRTKDLYGHAFAIFGLSAVALAWGDAEARDLALETFEVVERRLRLAEGWYAASAREDWTVDDRRLLQNPHMHLLEAYLALFEATGEARVRAAARGLVDLFEARLVDPATGVLREFFDEQGRPDPEVGDVVEPGHHFEWFWLLHRHAEVTGDRQGLAHADAMFHRARRDGLDPAHGGVYDQVSARDGQVLKATKRCWPLTECVKAHAVMLRRTGAQGDLEALRAQGRLLLDVYLRPDGGSVEHVDRALRPFDATTPASTGYHVLLALLEALRALPG